MIVVQYNYNYSYAIWMTAFGELKAMSADKASIQESDISESVRSHVVFGIWSDVIGKKNEEKIATGVAVNTRLRLKIEAQTDIINFIYIMNLELA